jgi:acetyltransferase
LLSCYGIPVARWKWAADVAGCRAAADQLGYPVVLKVDAEGVVHKTEHGAVVLDIRDRSALREQADRLLARFTAASPRLLVQEQLRGGQEVIVGAKAVPGLGHVLMFGLGGIYVEVLKDVCFKLTPVTGGEARQMVESLRAYPLLAGSRGQARVEIAALVETIQRVSQMLTDLPGVRELDLNPVFALTRGAKVADVRVMI